MDKANNRYVPKLLLSYVYVLDIRARLMRALESTTSCKRILLSRAPMCRKYFQTKIWFAFECFQRLILIFIFILTCICPICRHIILIHTTLATPNRTRGHAGKSCKYYRISLVTGKNSNNCRITLLLSQDFPVCPLFYPVQYCSVTVFQSNDRSSYFPYHASALFFPFPYLFLSDVPAKVRLAIAGGDGGGIIALTQVLAD